MENIIILKKVWRYLKKYQSSVYASILMTVLTVSMQVIEPFIIGLGITELSKNVMDMAKGIEGATINFRYIFIVLVVYLIRGAINHLSTFGATYFITEAVQNTMKDLRIAIIQKINRLPVAYFDRNQFGNLLGRVTSDVESVSNALQQGVLQIVSAILSIVLVTVMMLWLNWRLALMVLISMPVSYYLAGFVVKRSQKYFKSQADALGRLNGYVQESFSGFNIIKLYGREYRSSEEFRVITEELQEVGFKASFISGLMMPLVGVVSHLTYLAVALFGGILTIRGSLTLGNLQAFTQYVNQITQPIQLITQLSGPLQSARAALDRIFEILDQPEEANQVTTQLTGSLSGQVSFENVSFQYTPEKPLIKDFTVEVKPGEMIAIVGPTGAGKTTMINLLMRFYDVTAGAIKVDGIDIRDLSRREFREQFGMVLQDAWLFEGTIKENLQFGNLNATDEEIVEAAKMANVDHFIRTLPGGYNMRMNQESSNISLGQKQLLTIARALLSNPKILILDEATSSVDTRLEILIQKAMSRLMEGRTSFVIAHRLSTIQEADKIIVMKDGQIIEQGNHIELLKREGFYYDLYHSQFTQTS